MQEDDFALFIVNCIYLVLIVFAFACCVTAFLLIR